MKKILITTCTILMISVTANACGGIVVKGKSGADYCLSKHVMKWYSAYAWCDAQKMTLIDIESVCKNYNSCPELTLSSEQKKHITDNGGRADWVWSKTLASYQNSFLVNFNGSIGSIHGGGLVYGEGYPALCH